MAKQQSDIRKWALLGAEQRLVQIAEEAAAIHRTFPELRKGGHVRGAQFSQATARDVQAERRGRQNSRPKRTMSAAARKRISEAQKTRWAKQKASKK
jgi:hypothetical protein